MTRGKSRKPAPRRGQPAGADAGTALTKAAAGHRDARYVLRLYVAGMTPRSSAAIRAITQICEDHLKGRYVLDVIDIYRQPTLARGEQIIAAPTLIKKLPLPLRRMIGDMADTKRILVGLDLRSEE
ncbi:MAG TPA: circadian clock KaiB family protein [Acidobacteriota bacterium]|nr:circadian clock KaiB family protein [Acidobacteriota bacterium]